MNRKRVASFALFGPLAALFIGASPAGALSVPGTSTVVDPPAATAPVELPPVPPEPGAPSTLDNLVSQVPLPLPLTGLLSAPSIPPIDSILPGTVPCVCSPAAVPVLGSTERTRSTSGGTDAGTTFQAQSVETQSESASVSAGERFMRRVDAVSDRRARQPIGSRVQGEPVLVAETRPRGSFFGWFGSFMAFTGANLLRMVQVGAGALLLGAGTVTMVRRRRQPRVL